MAEKKYDPKYDLDKDGYIGILDFSRLYTHVGPVNYADPMSVACDFNKDGIVDEADLAEFKERYGTMREYVEPTAPPAVGWLAIGAIVLILLAVTATR